MFFLPPGTEVGDPFEISDDPGGMIHILGMAFAALPKGPFVNMGTLVADGDTDIETKIIAPGLGRGMDQFFESFLVRGFLQIEM
jgi:hypothetical protein